jgi:hypothetical protein
MDAPDRPFAGLCADAHNVGPGQAWLRQGCISKDCSPFPSDFRAAARFTGQDALFVHQAIRDAGSNIRAMPARHTSFPAGPTVYGVTLLSKDNRNLDRGLSS